MAGSFVMTCIVIVANIKLLISSYEMTLWLNLLVVTSIVVYLACFWFITWWSAESNDFGIFIELFENIESYFALVFFMSSYVLIDCGMRYASIEMRVLLEQRKLRHLYEAKLKELKNPPKNTAIRKRISTVTSKYTELFTTRLIIFKF